MNVKQIHAAFSAEELASMAGILQDLCDAETRRIIQDADRILAENPRCDATYWWHKSHVEQLGFQLGRFVPYPGIREDFFAKTGHADQHDLFDFVAARLP